MQCYKSETTGLPVVQPIFERLGELRLGNGLCGDLHGGPGRWIAPFARVLLRVPKVITFGMVTAWPSLRICVMVAESASSAAAASFLLMSPDWAKASTKAALVIGRAIGWFLHVWCL